MQKFLFILLCLPFAVQAQEEYTFNDLSGKWTEGTRTDKNNDVIPFKDTLFIEIRSDGFMLIRHTIGSTFYGTAELAENKLTLENETFTVEAVDRQILKLKQKKLSHRFVKVNEFNPSPVEKMSPGPESNDGDVSISALKGKWSVYKKTDPSFSSRTFYLKNFEVKEMIREKQYGGQASFHNMDSLYTHDAVIKLQDRELSIITDSRVMKAKIIKYDGEELLLEHGTATYYLKRFNR